MQKLSFIILILFAEIILAQSPHGKNFELNCEECHSTEKWDIDYKKLKFDHSITNFELVGQHSSLDCRSCHKTIVFSDVKQECSNCHTDIHQNSVGLDCAQCHTSQSWLVKDINEIHRMGRFPLEGAHKIADCEDCHKSIKNLYFEQLEIECFDCHKNDFDSAKQPNHIAAGFSTECQECHQLTNYEWSGALVTHDFFPLIGGHKISNCFDCHSQNSFEGLSQDCITCHQSDFNSTIDPNHLTSGFSNDCIECHTTNPGWQPATFSKHDNFFQLVGAHKLIESDCAKCHTNGFANTPNQCYDCHINNYTSTTNPNHQAAGFGTDCESCHTSTAWQPATFDHDNQFFPIYSGSHKGEWNECSDCHTNSANYQIFECITCHEHNQNDMNKEHSGVNGYVYESNACYSCHPTGNDEEGFNHSTTNFPLTGVHITTLCSDCHTSGYQNTSMECNSCHFSDFQNTVNPNHQQLGLEQNCEQCHSTNPNWQPSSFPVHNEFYLIEGAHVTISNDCNSCHNGDYVNNKNQCYDCHVNDYTNTTNPSHQSTGFGTDCETCHTQNAWEPATFDHDNQFFPIYSGKHNNEWNECSDCHTNSSNYQIFECITCHEHNQTDMDNEHKDVQGYQYISTECLACHPTGDEEGAFNHATSLFPITGAHSSQECSSCHFGSYSNASAECSSCHQSNFNNALEPKHNEAGISVKCENCHNSIIWKPSEFSHSTTGFELTGGHNLTQCFDCHSLSTANAISECFGCHENKYIQAPEHTAQNYPKTCQNCHNTINWEETNFDHNITNFALTGAHIGTSCDNCHSNGYTGTSTVCKDCHTNDFNISSNPSHTNLGLSTDCVYCHSTSPNWQPASFSVHNNYYALVGAHSSISNDCSTCHNGDYNITLNQCYDCHQSDYNSTTNPAHASSGFGTDCLDCHSQSAWAPSTFDHDGQYFPIYSGDHKGEWNTCSDCHNNANNFGQFTCLVCHEHSQSRMDDKHIDVNDYVYASNACYDCHPRGQGDIMIKKYFDKIRIEK